MRSLPFFLFDFIDVGCDFFGHAITGFDSILNFLLHLLVLRNLVFNVVLNVVLDIVLDIVFYFLNVIFNAILYIILNIVFDFLIIMFDICWFSLCALLLYIFLHVSPEIFLFRFLLLRLIDICFPVTFKPTDPLFGVWDTHIRKESRNERIAV